MASLVETLITNLTEQLDGYEKILELQDIKTNVIIHNQVESLQEVSGVERELVGRVSRLEREREKLMSDIAMVLNQEEKDLSMLRLAELIGKQKHESDTLINLREKLMTVLQQVKEKNKQNANLVEQALNYVDFTLNAIHSNSSTSPHNNGYEDIGQQGDKDSSTHYFDAKQ